MFPVSKYDKNKIKDVDFEAKGTMNEFVLSPFPSLNGHLHSIFFHM